MTDRNGNSTETDPISFVITQDSQAPVIRRTNPVDGAIVNADMAPLDTTSAQIVEAGVGIDLSRLGEQIQVLDAATEEPISGTPFYFERVSTGQAFVTSPEFIDMPPVNSNSGEMSAVSMLQPSQVLTEDWIITMVAAPGQTATRFQVFGTRSGSQGTGQVSQLFTTDNGVLRFTVFASDYNAGDYFVFTTVGETSSFSYLGFRPEPALGLPDGSTDGEYLMLVQPIDLSGNGGSDVDSLAVVDSVYFTVDTQAPYTTRAMLDAVELSFSEPTLIIDELVPGNSQIELSVSDSLHYTGTGLDSADVYATAGGRTYLGYTSIQSPSLVVFTFGDSVPQADDLVTVRVTLRDVAGNVGSSQFNFRYGFDTVSPTIISTFPDENNGLPYSTAPDSVYAIIRDGGSSWHTAGVDFDATTITLRDSIFPADVIDLERAGVFGDMLVFHIAEYERPLFNGTYQMIVRTQDLNGNLATPDTVYFSVAKDVAHPYTIPTEIAIFPTPESGGDSTNIPVESVRAKAMDNESFLDPEASDMWVTDPFGNTLSGTLTVSLPETYPVEVATISNVVFRSDVGSEGGNIIVRPLGDGAELATEDWVIRFINSNDYIVFGSNSGEVAIGTRGSTLEVAGLRISVSSQGDFAARDRFIFSTFSPENPSSASTLEYELDTTLPLDGSADGVYTIHVHPVDELGNAATRADTATFVYDTQAPTVTGVYVYPDTTNLIEGLPQIYEPVTSIVATLSDDVYDHDFEGVGVNFDASNIVLISPSGEQIQGQVVRIPVYHAIQFRPAGGAITELGEYQVRVLPVDNLGNGATGSSLSFRFNYRYDVEGAIITESSPEPHYIYANPPGTTDIVGSFSVTVNEQPENYIGFDVSSFDMKLEKANLGEIPLVGFGYSINEENNIVTMGARVPSPNPIETDGTMDGLYYIWVRANDLNGNSINVSVLPGLVPPSPADRGLPLIEATKAVPEALAFQPEVAVKSLDEVTRETMPEPGKSIREAGTVHKGTVEPVELQENTPEKSIRLPEREPNMPDVQPELPGMEFDMDARRYEQYEEHLLEISDRDYALVLREFGYHSVPFIVDYTAPRVRGAYVQTDSVPITRTTEEPVSLDNNGQPITQLILEISDSNPYADVVAGITFLEYSITGPNGSLTNTTFRFNEDVDSAYIDLSNEPITEEGLYVIEGTLTDAGGNVVEVPDRYHFIYDNAAPRLLSYYVEADTVGTQPTDITRWKTADVTQVSVELEDLGAGIDVENSEIRLIRILPDGSQQEIAGTKQYSDGRLSLLIGDGALGTTEEWNGEYIIEVDAVDRAQPSPHTVSGARSFFYDTRPPRVTSVTPANEANIDVSFDRVEVTVTDITRTYGIPGVGIDQVNGYDFSVEGPAGPVEGRAAFSDNNTFVYLFDDALPADGSVDGQYTIRVTLTDRLGNDMRLPFTSTFYFTSMTPEVVPGGTDFIDERPVGLRGVYKNGDRVQIRSIWNTFDQIVQGLNIDFSGVDNQFQRSSGPIPVDDDLEIIPNGNGYFDITYVIDVNNQLGFVAPVTDTIPITMYAGATGNLISVYEGLVMTVDNQPPALDDEQFELYFETSGDSAHFWGMVENGSTLFIEREVDDDVWELVLRQLIFTGDNPGVRPSSGGSYDRPALSTHSVTKATKDGTWYPSKTNLATIAQGAEFVPFDIWVFMDDGKNKYRVRVFDGAGNEGKYMTGQLEGQNYRQYTTDGKDMRGYRVTEDAVFVASPIPQPNDEQEILIRFKDVSEEQIDQIEVSIYNAAGDLVATVPWDGFFDSVERGIAISMDWNGLNDNGDKVNNGLYVFIIRVSYTSGAEDVYKKVGAVLQ